MLRVSSSIDSPTSSTQIIVEYDKIDDSGNRSDNFDVTFQITHWRSTYYLFARKSQ